ncbi:MAG: calcium/sodium antiporter [Vulcanimicrobiota bacterium]
MVYVLFAIGFILLIKGADFLIDGSSSLAKKFGISSLIVGLTVVAFGTSLPELIVNVLSALKGEGSADIALGNVLGSNIANILLIMGITATIYPLDVKVSTAWKEIPFSLFAVLVLLVMANDVVIDGLSRSVLTRSDGIILLCFFGFFLYYIIELALKHQDELPLVPHGEREKAVLKPAEGEAVGISETGEKIDTEEADTKETLDKESKDKEKKNGKEPLLPVWKCVFFIFLGVVCLFFGGRWVVDGAVEIAEIFKLSKFLISATIIAIGTSLPELVTSIMAAIKKEPDLSVGNIIGSNIFNTLLVLGVGCTVGSIPVEARINNDIIFVIIITLILFLYLFLGKSYKLERWQGISFVVLYVLYIIYIIMRDKALVAVVV